MCVVGSSAACANYEEDYDWMDRSGNVCWGMGAANEIPCRWCGQKPMYHSGYWDFPKDDWGEEDQWDDDGGNNGS